MDEESLEEFRFGKICGYKNGVPVFHGDRIRIPEIWTKRRGGLAYAFYSKKYNYELETRIHFRIPEWGYYREDCHSVSVEEVTIFPKERPLIDKEYEEMFI